MKDTAAEADGERNLVNLKLLLSVFKSMGTYSKYALEMFVSIAHIEGVNSKPVRRVQMGFLLPLEG